MTEMNSTVIEAAADPQGISYTPDAPEPKEASKPLSAREALEKAASEIEKDGTKIGTEEPKVEKPKAESKVEEKTEEKPEEETKQGRGEKGRFAAKETSDSTSEENGTEQEGEKESRSSEGREDDKPPARFLPRAKEKWATVDPDVRGEVLRMQTEMEKGLQEHRESHEFRKELRQFEDMAKQAGTTVRAALENYTNIDSQLRNDPVNAVARILQSVGITPQQYAQHVMGQAQQQQQNPQSAETQRLQMQIQQLTQTVQQLTQGTQQDRESARLAEVERNIIAPFMAEHPRYQELESDIVFFLNSDKIPSTLPERQRLEVAYDMAERINPAPSMQNTSQTRPLNPAGAKSIKGSPSPGTSARKMDNLSSREAIEAAMSQIGF